MSNLKKAHELIKQAIKHRRSINEIKETFVAVDYALEKMKEQNKLSK